MAEVHAAAASAANAREARASASPWRWVDDEKVTPGAVVPSTESITASGAFGFTRAVPERPNARASGTANRLVKEMDPTRPTTFNNPDPDKVCDTVNVHYPPMPYEDSAKDDPRPLFLGEYAFPVCHEQTDVRVDPGLRELWGAGHAEPDSEWGRKCAKVFENPIFGRREVEGNAVDTHRLLRRIQVDAADAEGGLPLPFAASNQRA